MTNKEIRNTFAEDFRRALNEDESGELNLTEGQINRIVSISEASFDYTVEVAVSDGKCELCDGDLPDGTVGIHEKCAAVLVSAMNEPPATPSSAG